MRHRQNFSNIIIFGIEYCNEVISAPPQFYRERRYITVYANLLEALASWYSLYISSAPSGSKYRVSGPWGITDKAEGHESLGSIRMNSNLSSLPALQSPHPLFYGD